MKFGSVCSGIEAASVAWKPLGWEPAWFAEVEPFPSAVLKHHYPQVPNLGDMTALPERILSGEIEAPEVFCGGTPCQAFSVAGNRESLADARGNLTLTFCEIANAIDTIRAQRGEQPCIVFWENVPGVLNTKDNAFGCFLGALAGEDCALEPPGGRWTDAGCVLGPERAIAWRTLDAQFFQLAQRRRRVFVVASARNGFDPAAVLFEFDGVRRDTAPSREPGKVAPTIPARSTGGGGMGTDFDLDGGLIARCVTAGEGKRQDYETCTMVLQQPVAFHPLQDPICSTYGTTHALGCGSTGGQASIAVAVDLPALTGLAVRRLTPRECERLMGFKDDYTAIPWRGKPADQCPDGLRYKALGNSWAAPVAAWVGARIQAALMQPANDSGQGVV